MFLANSAVSALKPHFFVCKYGLAVCHCEELAILSEAKELIAHSGSERREARGERRTRDSFSHFPLLVSHFPIGRLLRSFVARNDNIPGKKC